MFFEAFCLRCHGSSQQASREMLAMYSAERDVGRKQVELGGLDVVEGPVLLAQSSIKDATIWFAVAFAAGMLTVFATIQFFF
ncbi:hypothetical protein DFAR_1540014 [Desulfarculales bacterium]